MPKGKKKVAAVTSDTQAISTLAQRFRVAARSPSIYGYKPHAKQEQFHKSKAKGRLYIGGNRSGKTVGGAVEAIWRLEGKHPYQRVPEAPIDGRCVSVDFQQGVEKIVKPMIAKWLPPSSLINGSWEDSYHRDTRTLTLENNSTLEFMSYDQQLEKFAGTSRGFCWFDEEPPKPIFNECKARLVDQAGFWWITETPVEGMTWTHDDLYLPGKDPDNHLIDVIQVDITDNPFLNPGEIEEFLSGLDIDERKARKSGTYVASGGLIYPQFGDHHIIDPVVPPKEWLHLAGGDFGLNNPTCILWGAVNKLGDLVIYDEHYESGKVVSWHASKIKEANVSHGRVPDYYVGDPSARNRDPITGTSIQLEYIENGIPFITGNNDVKAGIMRVSGYFRGLPVGEGKYRQRFYVTKNCVNFLYEIKRYRWSVWAEKKARFDRNKKEEPHKKDDHAMDTLRYMVMSRPQMDDGTYKPESPGNFLGAPVGIDPRQPWYDRDTVSTTPTSPEYAGSVDSQMGGEY